MTLERRTPLKRGKPLQARSSLAKVRGVKAPKPRTCGGCGIEFVPKNVGPGIGRFCSQACWRTYEHARQPRRFEFDCQNCGTKFSRPAAWIRKWGKPKYCSRPCKDHARLRPGSTSHRGPGWRKIAEQIRERDGRLCVRCGATERPNRRHHVDHIIPWILLKHRPDVANDSANLASLCDRCHGIKTTVIEPRLFKGDLLGLVEFYGRPIADRVSAQLVEARGLGLVLGPGEQLVNEKGAR
jgi:hypothetical protein